MDLTTDFQELVSQNLDYEFLRNKTLLITGATGMLGRYLTEYFIYLNAVKNLNLRILLIVRNLKKVELLFGDKLNKRNSKIDFLLVFTVSLILSLCHKTTAISIKRIGYTLPTRYFIISPQ